MAIQQGAKYLEMAQAGRGCFWAACRAWTGKHFSYRRRHCRRPNEPKWPAAWGQGYLLDASLDRLRYLSDVMPANASCFFPALPPFATSS
jgi:alanine dehydrogenase